MVGKAYTRPRRVPVGSTLPAYRSSGDAFLNWGRPGWARLAFAYGPAEAVRLAALSGSDHGTCGGPGTPAEARTRSLPLAVYRATVYAVRAIKNTKNAKTRRVHETGKPRSFKGLDGGRAVRVLNLLAAADRLDDLPRLASYRLHKLSAARAGQWSLTINLPWVVCFAPDREGGWRDVEITDYH